MKSTFFLISTSESISRNPSGNSSQSFCTLIMWRSDPQLLSVFAHLLNRASSMSRFNTWPLVLSITVTFFIDTLKGRCELLSNTVT